MTDAVASEPQAAAPDPKRWLIAITVSIAALLEIVDTSIVNVALNDMQAQMGATLTAIGWVITSYSVANVIILPMSAWLGDVFGKKRYFLFSLIAFTTASVMCGLANSLGMLIFSRVLQGIFGGGLLAKAQSILFETFPPEEQAIAQGLFGAVVISGPTIGPVLGGYIVTNSSWRWIFFVNLPVGIIAAILTIIYLPKDKPFVGITRAVDYLTILALAVGLGSFQTVLEEGQTEDWFSSSFIRFFSVLSVVGVAGFLWRTLRSNAPLVDLRVLKHRSLWIGCIIGTLLGAGLYGANFTVPIFAQNFMGLTAEQTGYMLAPGALMSAVGMMMVSILVRRIEPRLLLMCGMTICALTTYSMHHINPAVDKGFFFWPMLIRGLGVVMIFMPLNLYSLGPLPKKDISQASGLFNLFRQMGGSIGIAVLTTVLERRTIFHRTMVVGHLSPNDPKVTERVGMMAQNYMAHGTDPISAQHKAMASLDGLVQMQSAILGYADTFVIVGCLFMCMVPLVLLYRKVDPNAKVSMGH